MSNPTNREQITRLEDEGGSSSSNANILYSGDPYDGIR
jgi:hypothetical protein